MVLSTISGSGIKKSEEYISGLKKISGARKRSYPTSTEYCCRRECAVSGVFHKADTKSYTTGHRMLAIVPLEILVGLRVVLSELLDDVLTHVRIILLDLSGDLQLVLGRHLRHLAALSHEIEHELRDVPPGYRDVFDGAPDHVALGAGNDMGHAVARVDDRASERAVGHAVRGPRCGEGEHGLDGDVQPLNVERLEEDFGRLLAILRGVQRWFGLYEPVCMREGEKKIR